MQNDITILRELSRRYAEIAALPVQNEKRKLWADHFSLRPTRVPVLLRFGMHNVWCREVFCDANMKCGDPFYRSYERELRLRMFHYETGDDQIQEPWLVVGVPHKEGQWNNLWGMDESLLRLNGAKDGNAGCYNPPLKSWDDIGKLRAMRHVLDEEAGARNHDKLASAVGDILEIDVQRPPVYNGFTADISTSIAKLRGLEQLMVDMYESPDELHKLLAFMRDGILANNRAAEDAGHYTLTLGANQQLAYANELETPRANAGPRKRKDIWGFFAAQEYALVSPEFHDEFLFQYQLPIMEHYGLTHYGCCEDLGEKMAMLRGLKNLRSIAVAPRADVRRCAEQIGGDYVMSWRPNPADMVCCGYDEARIEKIVRKAMDDSEGCFIHINLKDVETLEGDNTRMRRWVKKVREIVER